MIKDSVHTSMTNALLINLVENEVTLYTKEGHISTKRYSRDRIANNDFHLVLFIMTIKFSISSQNCKQHSDNKMTTNMS